MKSLVGEVACYAERDLGVVFGLNPWSGSMLWAARGESRVGRHVNSHWIDILVVPWVPKDLVCLAYDFMRAVGHVQGLQELVSHFFYFFRYCLVLPKKRRNPPAAAAT